jgi:hypothetical protein
VAGLLAQHLSPTWGYALAASAPPGAGLRASLPCPRAAAPRRAGAAPRPAAIQAGARFVVSHELLRGISLCAIFWNFAFFALLAIWAPLALNCSARSGEHGPRAVGLWRRPDPGRAGRAGVVQAPAAARHAHLWPGRVGDRRRLSSGGPCHGERLRLSPPATSWWASGRCCG